MGGADNNKIRAEQAMREQALRQQAEQSRKADMAAGRQRGEEAFGGNALGKIEGGRAAEVADLINMRKQQLGVFPKKSKTVSLSGTREFSNHNKTNNASLWRGLGLVDCVVGLRQLNRPIWPERP